MAIPSLLQKEYQKLIEKSPAWKAAVTPPAKGAKPGSVSTGRPAATSGGGSSAAFEESDYGLREYWASRAVAVSSDGLLVSYAEPIKSVALVGGTAATFKEPV